MQIISEPNPIANLHNHESHCSQSLCNASEVMKVTNLSTIFPTVRDAPQLLTKENNVLRTQQPVSQPHSIHVNTLSPQNALHLNTMSCRLATHHRNKFHEQQVK